MFAYYNPLDEFYKNVIGAVKKNSNVVFRIKTSADLCCLKICSDNGECSTFLMCSDGEYYKYSYAADSVGLFWYTFILDGKEYGMDANGYASDSFGELEEHGSPFQLTVYKEEYETPDWFKGGVIYQIFPDRFCREGAIYPRKEQLIREDVLGTPNYKPIDGVVLNNDFFGGNIKGIISKLAYLKDLGVTIIYLNPIFKARSNHRYDTGDYMTVDELLGDESILKKLFNTADRLGIKIVLDGVFNHTGDDSLYFNKYNNYGGVGAYNSKLSKYYNWYSFTDYPDKYSSWWGIEIMPQTNKKSKSFTEYICGKNGVLRYYLKLGASGWRLDVVDEIPDFFVKEIRKAVKKENKEAIIIGEVWENVTDKVAYGKRKEYFQGDELDSAMNYPLANAIKDFLLWHNTTQLVGVIRQQIDNYPQKSLHAMMNHLGTHDTPRIVNILSGVSMPYGKDEQATSELDDYAYSLGVRKLRIASALLFTLYGVPSIYYGDERGLTGWGDPFNRRCIDWDNGSDLIDWYSRLGAIRKQCKVFACGDTRIEYCTKSAIIFSRSYDDEKIYVCANLSGSSLNLTFSNCVVDLLNDKSGSDFQVSCLDVGIFKEQI